MRKAWIWTGVVVLALALGVGGAAGASVLIAGAHERGVASGRAPAVDDEYRGSTMPYFANRGQWMMPGLRAAPRGGQDTCPFDGNYRGLPRGMMGGRRGSDSQCPFFDGSGAMPGGMMRSWRGFMERDDTTPWSGRMPFGRGEMWGFDAAPSTDAGERITMDAAVEAAQTYAQSVGEGLVVAEVMEFDQNFYALLTEKETGRGAMEVLIDPITGAVHPEPGPNMRWNLKYGHMGRFHAQAEDNTLTLDEARAKAQAFVDEDLAGASLAEGGVSFYGYYTFDYLVDGKPAGMLSVNGLSGQVWPHTWHGTFVAEKELEQ